MVQSSGDNKRKCGSDLSMVSWEAGTSVLLRATIDNTQDKDSTGKINVTAGVYCSGSYTSTTLLGHVDVSLSLSLSLSLSHSLFFFLSLSLSLYLSL